MKKFFLVIAAVLAFSTTALAQVVEWKAVAVANDSNPKMFWLAPVYGDSEPDAAMKAMTKCEHVSARPCPRSITTSVPIDWWLVISWCDGVVTSGGSRFDQWAANTRAAMKLGYLDGVGCTIQKVYAPE